MTYWTKMNEILLLLKINISSDNIISLTTLIIQRISGNLLELTNEINKIKFHPRDPLHLWNLKNMRPS
ncbi:hypothetical protein RCL_jg13924.t1 [Rhizophagus clarus]|uniref:Uncharacterized protein n=1 Tax=Rhizophagus clarus TaxID=94130 RepID=A0A8H3LTM8_9GLOM|nr:hypothetical protein RCL_jg13924.t1 [Rhizophagus clarus]